MTFANLSSKLLRCCYRNCMNFRESFLSQLCDCAVLTPQEDSNFRVTTKSDCFLFCSFLRLRRWQPWNFRESPRVSWFVLPGQLGWVGVLRLPTPCTSRTPWTPTICACLRTPPFLTGAATQLLSSIAGSEPLKTMIGSHASLRSEFLTKCLGKAAVLVRAQWFSCHRVTTACASKKYQRQRSHTVIPFFPALLEKWLFRTETWLLSTCGKYRWTRGNSPCPQVVNPAFGVFTLNFQTPSSAYLYHIAHIPRQCILPHVVRLNTSVHSIRCCVCVCVCDERHSTWHCVFQQYYPDAGCLRPYSLVVWDKAEEVEAEWWDCESGAVLKDFYSLNHQSPAIV